MMSLPLTHSAERYGAVGTVWPRQQTRPNRREESALSPSVAPFAAPSQQPDVGTVVKVLQTLSREIKLSRLLEILMKVALEHAGAERGTLVLLRGDELRIEAQARAVEQSVEVTLRQAAVTPVELPESILNAAFRTGQSVLLDDAQRSVVFGADEYVRRRRPRSVLCLPLLNQAERLGLLYLESNFAPGWFTSQRAAFLELLASQAAISLTNARVHEGLRRRAAFLAEAQSLGQTGNWEWNVTTGEIRWSVEHLCTFGFDPTVLQPSYAEFLKSVHPEDRPRLEETLDRAVYARGSFQHEYRIVLPDGSIRHQRCAGHPVDDPGDLEYIGTVIDITDRKRADEALWHARAELARAARLTTMGQLATSIVHEINQPLAALVTSAGAGLCWLNRKEPDLDEVRALLSRIASEGRRAADVIKGLRMLARSGGPDLAKLDLADIMSQVLMLTEGALRQQNVVVQMEQLAGDNSVLGDRVQVHQVLLNLVMNALEAMSGVTDRPKMLSISSKRTENNTVLVAIADTGPGVDPAIADRIFDSLFTTKPEGMGMGLSICRSIIEAHGGRLWASPNLPCGSIFRFTLPGAPTGAS
jgi:PAS domain S-box-containing protein